MDNNVIDKKKKELAKEYEEHKAEAIKIERTMATLKAAWQERLQRMAALEAQHSLLEELEGTEKKKGRK